MRVVDPNQYVRGFIPLEPAKVSVLCDEIIMYNLCVVGESFKERAEVSQETADWLTRHDMEINEGDKVIVSYRIKSDMYFVDIINKKCNCREDQCLGSCLGYSIPLDPFKIKK